MHNFCYVNGFFRPVYKYNFAFGLRYNEELHELLGGPNIVKYIKIKRLQWVGHIV